MTLFSFLGRAGASLAAACTLVSAPAFGQAPPNASAWADRERLFAHFGCETEARLKATYLRCAHESSQRLLGFEEAARCSIAGEVLKARSFGGDFSALLAWWRQHRDERIVEASDPGAPVMLAVCRRP